MLGTFTVRRGDEKKVVEFLGEGIRLISGVRSTNPLGEILIRTRKLTSGQLDRLLAEQRKTGERLGDLVAAEGILSKEAIDHALREQVAEEIYDLFLWSEATFEFVEAGGAAPVEEGPLSTVILDANVMSIMLEAARRLDELTRIREVIPDERLVAEQLELPAELDDPGLDRNVIEDVLPLVDGARSIERIIEDSCYPRFTILLTLYGLVQRGILKIRDLRSGDGPITVLRRTVPPIPEDPARKAPTILLLSELVTFRNALAFCLRSEGLDVVEGARWDESAQALCQEYVGAIVLDLPIETEDGLTLCRRLRGSTKTPFILLSGNTSKKAVAHALQSGARYVLVKPIKEDLLVDRVYSLVGSVEQARDS